MTDLNALKQANAIPRLNLSELKEVLHYDPETGVFRWLKATSNRIKIGDIAGSPHSKGYITICALGERFLAHRLAWFYMKGSWPAEIDHKDCQRSNNKWENLREATCDQNGHNTPLRKTNTTGFKGVVAIKPWLFSAYIRHKNKRLYLGCFKSAATAHEAYKAKAAELYGEFARVA